MLLGHPLEIDVAAPSHEEKRLPICSIYVLMDA